VRRALSFLTVLGRAAEPNERTLSWFPLVGIAVGAVVGLSWWAAARVWPAALAAVVAVAVDAAVTGCLHLDGLVDAADGLLPAVGRARRLEIMSDPRIGAFGAVVLVLVLSLRVTALAVTVARPSVVVGLWCGSRTMMGVVARTLPYAHADGGTATAFVGAPGGHGHSAASRYGVAAYGMGAAFALAAVGAGGRGLVVVGVEVVAMVGVVWFAFRRLGGYTGDVLGAMGVIGETVGLLALVAR
jgi:adenosylcobinamide-GDP ribazoletransferase